MPDSNNARVTVVMTKRSLHTAFRKEVLAPPSNPPTYIELLPTTQHKQCLAGMHLAMDKEGRPNSTTRHKFQTGLHDHKIITDTKTGLAVKCFTVLHGQVII